LENERFGVHDLDQSPSGNAIMNVDGEVIDMAPIQDSTDSK
jgi:hypothetical protein